jgi:Protein of unknown function (DUF1488)
MHSPHNIPATKMHGMHASSVLTEPARNFTAGVRFMMIDSATRVTRWVSREALDRIQRGNACQLGPMACFERHHLKLEHVASQKYYAAERSPIVLSFDIET